MVLLQQKLVARNLSVKSEKPNIKERLINERWSASRFYVSQANEDTGIWPIFFSSFVFWPVIDKEKMYFFISGNLESREVMG